MAEADLLAFYQQFYTESLFIVPEQAPGSPVLPPPANNSALNQPDPEPAETDTGETLAAKKFTVTGQNKKGLALAFSLSEADFAVLPQNNFLIKILAAIQRKTDDVAYINLPRNVKLNLFDLTKQTPVQHLVVFGNALLDLDASFKVNLYKPAAIGNIPVLIADPLENIENDVNRKKLLWSGLQAIFIK